MTKCNGTKLLPHNYMERDFYLDVYTILNRI